MQTDSHFLCCVAGKLQRSRKVKRNAPDSAPLPYLTKAKFTFVVRNHADNRNATPSHMKMPVALVVFAQKDFCLSTGAKNGRERFSFSALSVLHFVLSPLLQAACSGLGPINILKTVWYKNVEAHTVSRRYYIQACWNKNGDNAVYELRHSGHDGKFLMIHKVTGFCL